MKAWNSRKKALLLFCTAAVLLCAVAVAGIFLEGRAMQTDFSQKNLAPSLQYPFGTDWMGRDMLARTLTGLSLSIRIGVLTAAVSAVIALAIGIAAALLGPKVDAALSWCMDLVMGIPHILLVMLISLAFGRGFAGVVAGVALSHWPSLSRVIRGEVLQLRQAAYVRAAEKLGTRKAELLNMGTRETGTPHLEFKIPARGLMGYRSEFLTDTNGNGIMNHVFDCYEPYKGDILQRQQGSLIAHETGETTGYGLFAAQDRGRLFVGPGVPVYEGMIVGASPKSEDITVNVCKKKHVTNTRAAGSDEALKLTPPSIMSLEQSLEFITDDELVEVTPKSIRLRKTILNKEQRMKNASRKG